MAKGKTLSDFSTNITEITNYMNTQIASKTNLQDLVYLFNVAITDFSNFPGKNGLNEQSTFSDYLDRWIKDYEDGITKLPSKRTANPKSTCDDPSVKQLVKSTQGITQDEVDAQSEHHNLFMSAENIQGALLEEYISMKIRPYGWIWCAGESIHAVDFCTTNGSYLLQVKNKNNTENSSSSAIRNGTSIEKWYRLKSKKTGTKYEPVYLWDSLNQIINSNNITGISEPCNMSEDDYQNFLKQVAIANPNIINKN